MYTGEQQFSLIVRICRELDAHRPESEMLCASATLTIRQKLAFGHFTCWQVCLFGGDGNDMSLPNPDAEK
jgi:hypothetical protein